ncbi:hypothetical protein J2X98_002493 [Pseudarthrobacter enclensis]|uniref:Uncharacterized protein n=1 Tax=Pseudarthrobacter enclensis TaxID=993070 RepID=A0ABT9RUI6_9MICC|nr:hypothetical protein [Pseudarthrobacter enclensis]
MLLLPTVGPVELRVDQRRTGSPNPVPVQPVELDTPVHRDAAGLQRLPENVLDVGLPDQGQVRECGVRQVRVAKQRFDGAPAQVDARLGGGVRTAEQLVRHAQWTEPLQRPGMQHHRPGGPDPVLPPVHHPHRCPVRMGLEGGGEAGGTCAHHQDVRVRRRAFPGCH